ncbi:radical SAM protein, partial [Candidatus Bathyarchaeota archaeon]
MPLSADEIWRTSTKELLDLINTGRLAPKNRAIRFYGPSFMYYKTSYYSSSLMHFPTISLTGTACTLNCKHCEGKVLQTMQPAESPKKLFTLATKLKHLGAFGCLLSGGCLPDGSIPLTRFIPTIEKIKRELGLTVFIHTGIIRLDTAIALKNAGVDAALIDVIGSDETVKQIGNQSVTVKDYADSLKALQQADLKFVPHVIVGLHDGRLKGELNALKLIAPVNPSAIVIIAFMPIFGTAMAEIKPPQPTEIARIIATA